ncbi:hypothetical protein HMPREF9372_2894 [Sporosarcina newyorkensis 2681]|uniref:Uncharacterized protein n=1 Tax=Sporosarcina newyorkensis 2681 TaxID=1027292 RepID=F9DVR3_9BACL|nr:hypothetical protein HMPREF9372_2894 [Sporosarcina newyorkensis 2681]
MEDFFVEESKYLAIWMEGRMLFGDLMKTIHPRNCKTIKTVTR